LITTRGKTEKNAKKGKNLLFWTYRPQGPNEREKMNSKEIAQVIQAERDKLDGLKVDVWNTERRISELVAQKIRIDNDEADKFFADRFKIISVK
jgi:hypothetical protein